MQQGGKEEIRRRRRGRRRRKRESFCVGFGDGGDMVPSAARGPCGVHGVRESVSPWGPLRGP